MKAKTPAGKGKAKTAAKPSPRRAAAKPRRAAAVDAPPDKTFWVNEGPVIKNLLELCDALEAMSDEQFAHHVDAEKNDFARWVDEVLGDSDCARALRRARKRQTAQRAIAVRITLV